MFHTSCDDLAEDIDAVNDRTVPATILKLMLALADRKLGAVTHSDHVLGVAPAYSPLTPRQPGQTPTLGARERRDVVWRYGVGRQVTDTTCWRRLSVGRRQCSQRPVHRYSHVIYSASAINRTHVTLSN